MLRENIGRICISLQSAIKNCRDGGGTDVDGLRHDIRNIVYHVLGEHENCRSYFCSKPASAASKIDTLKSNEKVFDSVLKLMERVAVDADRLRLGLETNAAERAFSSDAKFVAGKRQNLSNLGSYARRFNMTILLQNEGYGWSKNVLAEFSRTEPGPVYDQYVKQRENQKLWTAKSKSRPDFIRTSKTTVKEDSYGKAALLARQQPDEEEILLKTEEFQVVTC